jgi:large repetitive protein
VTNAALVDSQSLGTIVDDEPRITITDVAKREGRSGSTLFIFTVKLSGVYDQAVTVNYATADGTATAADHDYQPKTGTLTFAPGETSKTITVVVYGDRKNEGDESFTVNLTGASSNTLITDGTGIGTILNDDH